MAADGQADLKFWHLQRQDCKAHQEPCSDQQHERQASPSQLPQALEICFWKQRLVDIDPAGVVPRSVHLASLRVSSFVHFSLHMHYLMTYTTSAGRTTLTLHLARRIVVMRCTKYGQSSCHLT